MQLIPYLNFNGQCEEAFRFYAECFGGEIVAMMNHGDSPIADQVPADRHSSILHARLTVGDYVLMGSDSPAEHYRQPAGMSVSIGVDDPVKADRIFQALAENGTVQMPIGETFWAKRFGMVIDRFGIPWMINCE